MPCSSPSRPGQRRQSASDRFQAVPRAAAPMRTVQVVPGRGMRRLGAYTGWSFQASEKLLVNRVLLSPIREKI